MSVQGFREYDDWLDGEQPGERMERKMEEMTTVVPGERCGNNRFLDKNGGCKPGYVLGGFGSRVYPCENLVVYNQCPALRGSARNLFKDVDTENEEYAKRYDELYPDKI